MSSSKHNKDKLPFGADKSGLHLVRKKSKGTGDKDKDKERRKSASKGLGISNTLATAMLHAVGGKGSGKYYVEKVKPNEGSKSSGSRRGSSMSDSFDRLGIEDDHDRHRRQSGDWHINSRRYLLYDPSSSTQSYESRDERDYYGDDGYDSRYDDERRSSLQSSRQASEQSSHHRGGKNDEIASTGTSTLYDRTHGVQPGYEETTRSSKRTARPPPPRAHGHQDQQDRYFDPGASTRTKSSASTVRRPGRKTTGFRAPSPDRSSHGHKGRHSGNPFSDPKKGTPPLQRGPEAEVTDADDRSSLAGGSSKASTAAEFSLPPMGTSRHGKTSSSRQPETPLRRGPKAEITEADDRASLVSSKFSLPPVGASRHAHSGTSSSSRKYEPSYSGASTSRKHETPHTGTSSSRRHEPPHSKPAHTSSRKQPSTTWFYSRDSDTRDSRDYIYNPNASASALSGYDPPSESQHEDSRPDPRDYIYRPYPPSSSSAAYSAGDEASSTAYGPDIDEDQDPNSEYYAYAPLSRSARTKKTYIPGDSSTVTGTESIAYASDSDDTVRGGPGNRGSRADSGGRNDRRSSGKEKEQGPFHYARSNFYKE